MESIDKARWTIAGGLLLALALLIIFFLVSGCGGGSSPITPVPPIAQHPPTLKGIYFKWTLLGPLPKLPDCALGGRPCLQYAISESGKVIAHPAAASLSYLLQPAPKKGLHTYTLVLQVVSNNGSVKSSLVPAITNVLVK